MKKVLKYSIIWILFEIIAYIVNYGAIQMLGLGNVFEAAGDFSKPLPNTLETGLYTAIQMIWIFATIAGIVIYILFLIRAILGRKEMSSKIS